MYPLILVLIHLSVLFIHLLVICIHFRSYFHDEQLFGIDPQDDMDVLFFAYAHCIAEGQEGKWVEL